MTQQQKSEYTVNDNSPTYFGKYKGQKHHILKSDPSYCDWILSTESTFAAPTKTWLRSLK